jgi:hypothetical protein
MALFGDGACLGHTIGRSPFRRGVSRDTAFMSWGIRHAASDGVHQHKILFRA